jgi:PAS domain S-box-containing protein
MATSDDLTPRRLPTAAHENARRLAALAALTAELAAAGEPRAVLERAVDAAAELLEAHTAAAFLCRADGRGFDAAAARGLAPLEPGAAALSLERSIAGRALASRTVEAVEDVAPERAAGTVFPRLAGDAPVGAVLAAPIAEGGTEPLGVLEVYTAAPRAWPDEDRELLRALAAACAVALRGAREVQALRDSEARLALQYAVTAVLARSTTLHDAIPALLRTICDQLRWDVGVFWIVDRRDNVLRCRDIWHRPSVDVAGFEARSRQSAFPPGIGLPGRVWASAAPAVIADLATDTNFPRAPTAVAEGLHGAVCFPIVIRNAVHGVMDFFSRDVEQLNASLVQVMTTLGTQIGQFIERTRAEDALRENEARKGTILEAALDCIVTIDHEGKVIEFNPAAEKTFGYSRSEVIGREMADLIIPPSLRDRHRTGLAQYRATGEGSILGRRVELTAMRANGTEFPVEVAVTQIPRDGPPLFTGHIRDITERKQAEDARAALLARERAARAEAEAAQQRLAFLAAASTELAASLDYEATLTSLARLAVPYFADWCGIDMLEEDGSIRQLAVAHVDPSKVEWARALRHRYPIERDAPRGVPYVLRTGQSEIYAEIPDSMLVASARDAEELEILRRVGLNSAMLVPLVAHGRVLGVITFVAAEAGHHYGPADLALAEDFARRAALAVDNARLFATARKDARRKAALAALTAELAAAGEPRAVLERAVDAAGELLEAHTAAAFLRRADGRGFDAAAARGLAPLELGAPVLSLERSIAGRALASRTVEAVEDVAPERAAGTVFPRLAGDAPVGAVLAAPIAEGGAEPLGVLEVYTAAPRAWPDEDRELLRALAATCAVALRQRRLLATTQDDARRLRALNRVAEVVIGAPTFGAMGDRALAVLTEVLDVGAAAIHVYDETAPPERALRMVSWHGISDEAADAAAALPVGVGVIGQAALRRGPVVAHERDAAPGRIASAPTATAGPIYVHLPGLQGRVSAPMLVRGRLLGVLTVGTPEPCAWRAADLSLLQTVANQLAAALEAEQLRSAAAAAAAAREAERLKSELLSTVSHELRTPLGAIKGFASGLLHYGDRLDEAERTESLRSIDHAADRLTELIDNLLDLQRLEAGRLTVVHGMVDLVELATMVVTEMAPQAPNHTLDLMIAPDIPPVMGDARRLRQVLQNLVENGVKYSPNGGRIAVRVQASPGVVELRVEDEGVGIPPDQLHAIFERFHRVDNSATRRIGGTGLGLSIVKGLVTAHGGTIRAESEGEGRGSTFVVTLPTRQKGATAE